MPVFSLTWTEIPFPARSQAACRRQISSARETDAVRPWRTATGFVARLQRRENEDLPRFPRKAQFPPLFGERDGETVREPVQRARRTDGAVPVTVRLDDGAELYPFGQFFPDRGGVAADGFQIDISAVSHTVII